MLFKIKTGLWLMARNRIVVLAHHHHKLLDLTYITSMHLVYIQSLGNLNELRFSWLRLPSNHLAFLMKCKVLDTVPKDLILKAPDQSHHSSTITLRASKALLSNRIQFYHFKKATLNKSTLWKLFSGDQ
jgi:hypothetical protein